MRRDKRWMFAASVVLLAVISGGQRLAAQGCVAAHSNQRSMDELVRAWDGGTKYGWSIHNLTVDIGYRFFNSNKYFVGDEEIPRANAIRNHQNIFDVGVEYRFTPQWSFIADVPVFNGTRNQLYPPSGVFQVSGIGDITLGAQRWIFRPPTEFGGDVAVSASVKIPTGINDATGSALYKGQTVKATADQSLQPGDGGWGFVLAAQGYKSLWEKADLYGQAQYLFNPLDTNGIATFRSQPGQNVMSVTDQYLYRMGISQGMPKLRGVALSLGARGEGVPVRDLIGGSNGFRRPGSVISLDPGLMVNVRRTTVSVNGPWALRRDRPPSVPEIKYGTRNGDAFFADYTVLFGITHHF